MSSIGERIKKSRNDRGLSLRELATKVELSASFLSQIEQGKASPSIENLKKIATSLDVKVSYLIEDEEEKQNTELVRKDNRKYIESLDSNTKMALLTTSNIDKAMEPLYTTRPEWERSGMGFAFMEAFMDEMRVESEVSKGTKIYMKKKVGAK